MRWAHCGYRHLNGGPLSLEGEEINTQAEGATLLGTALH